MQVNNTNSIFNKNNYVNANSNEKSVSKAEDDASEALIDPSANTESNSAQTTEDTLTEEEKARIEEEQRKEQERLEAERWQKFINEFGYDRDNCFRPAIADHGKKYGEAEGVNTDKVYAYNGLDQTTEDSIEGVQLDLDKYNDFFAPMLEDTGDEAENQKNYENYLRQVGIAIEQDLAKYYDINVNYQTGEGEKELASIYRQILNNAGIQELDTSSPSGYNLHARTELAKLSCDEGSASFLNDYICLDSTETNSNKTESGLEKRTVDDDSAKKMLTLAESYEGKESKDCFTKPFFERINYAGADDTTAWCAAFASYVALESGAEVEDWFKNLGYESASCARIYEQAYANNAIVVDPNDVQPGDLVIYDYYHEDTDGPDGPDGNNFYYETNGIMDHIGIVTDMNSDGSFSTIEGNTGYSEGSQHGKVGRHDYTLGQMQAEGTHVYFIRVLK